VNRERLGGTKKALMHGVTLESREGVSDPSLGAVPPSPRKVINPGIFKLARSIHKHPDGFAHVVKTQMRWLLGRMGEDEIVRIFVGKIREV